MIGQYFRNFINENSTLIDNKNFKEVYEKLKDDAPGLADISLFTKLLYKSGINPLRFSDTISEFMYYRINYESLTNENIIYVLKNNLFIKTHAFDSFTVQKIEFQAAIAPVLTIASFAFSDCNVEEIDLYNRSVRIHKNAFKDCMYLSKIRLPNYAIIDEGAFENCRKLKTMEYNGTMEELKRRSLTSWIRGNKVEKIQCIDGTMELHAW